jgi:hypothetical protein
MQRPKFRYYHTSRERDQVGLIPTKGKSYDKGDTNDIKALADGYEKKKWQAIASKHFDKSGHRITAEEARKMAEMK